MIRWPAACLLVAVGGLRQSNGAQPAGTSTLTIAVIPKGTSHVFWQSIHAGANQAAKELGAR